MAKSLYKGFTRVKHPFRYLKLHMERNNDEIPQYIEFESNRIKNFEKLVQGYMDYCKDILFSSRKKVEQKFAELANKSKGNCLSCLYSRIDKNYVDYTIRRCKFNYLLNDNECLKTREEFTMRIRKSNSLLPQLVIIMSWGCFFV